MRVHPDSREYSDIKRREFTHFRVLGLLQISTDLLLSQAMDARSMRLDIFSS